MLVEDNPDHVLLIKEALEDGGIVQKTFVVNDGEAALDFLNLDRQDENNTASCYPDLILLDLKLPKISGLEVLKKIKSDRQLKQIPVVVISSSLREEDVVAAYETGVNSYIAKPVNFDELTDRVKQVQTYWFNTNVLPMTDTY
jgi:CheY-like chemotaxis protein